MVRCRHENLRLELQDMHPHIGNVRLVFLLFSFPRREKVRLSGSQKNLLSPFMPVRYISAMADIERARQLRQTETWAEKLVWSWLRGRRFNGYKFRRQHPVGV